MLRFSQTTAPFTTQKFQVRTKARRNEMGQGDFYEIPGFSID